MDALPFFISLACAWLEVFGARPNRINGVNACIYMVVDGSVIITKLNGCLVEL